jgi:hypothetical protein
MRNKTEISIALRRYRDQECTRIMANVMNFCIVLAWIFVLCAFKFSSAEKDEAPGKFQRSEPARDDSNALIEYSPNNVLDSSCICRITSVKDPAFMYAFTLASNYSELDGTIPVSNLTSIKVVEAIQLRMLDKIYWATMSFHPKLFFNSSPIYMYVASYWNEIVRFGAILSLLWLLMNDWGKAPPEKNVANENTKRSTSIMDKKTVDIKFYGTLIAIIHLAKSMNLEWVSSQFGTVFVGLVFFDATLKFNHEGFKDKEIVLLEACPSIREMKLFLILGSALFISYSLTRSTEETKFATICALLFMICIFKFSTNRSAFYEFKDYISSMVLWHVASIAFQYLFVLIALLLSTEQPYESKNDFSHHNNSSHKDLYSPTVDGQFRNLICFENVFTKYKKFAKIIKPHESISCFLFGALIAGKIYGFLQTDFCRAMRLDGSFPMAVVFTVLFYVFRRLGRNLWSYYQDEALFHRVFIIYLLESALSKVHIDDLHKGHFKGRWFLDIDMLLTALFCHDTIFFFVKMTLYSWLIWPIPKDLLNATIELFSGVFSEDMGSISKVQSFINEDASYNSSVQFMWLNIAQFVEWILNWAYKAGTGIVSKIWALLAGDFRFTIAVAAATNWAQIYVDTFSTESFTAVSAHSQYSNFGDLLKVSLVESIKNLTSPYLWSWASNIRDNYKIFDHTAVLPHSVPKVLEKISINGTSILEPRLNYSGYPITRTDIEISASIGYFITTNSLVKWIYSRGIFLPSVYILVAYLAFRKKFHEGLDVSKSSAKNSFILRIQRFFFYILKYPIVIFIKTFSILLQYIQYAFHNIAEIWCLFFEMMEAYGAWRFYSIFSPISTILLVSSIVILMHTISLQTLYYSGAGNARVRRTMIYRKALISLPPFFSYYSSIVARLLVSVLFINTVTIEKIGKSANVALDPHSIAYSAMGIWKETLAMFMTSILKQSLDRVFEILLQHYSRTYIDEIVWVISISWLLLSLCAAVSILGLADFTPETIRDCYLIIANRPKFYGIVLFALLILFWMISIYKLPILFHLIHADLKSLVLNKFMNLKSFFGNDNISMSTAIDSAYALTCLAIVSELFSPTGITMGELYPT